jgi:hypothetical protein
MRARCCYISTVNCKFAGHRHLISRGHIKFRNKPLQDAFNVRFASIRTERFKNDVCLESELNLYLLRTVHVICDDFIEGLIREITIVSRQ